MLSTVFSDERWESRLAEKIADTAAWLFNYRPVTYDRLREYLEEIKITDKWEDGFPEEVYNAYLQKISACAEKLSQKLREE